MNQNNSNFGEENEDNKIDNEEFYQINSRKRANMWITDNSNNYHLLESLKYGLYDKKSVFNHNFRDIDQKEKNVSKTNFFNRKYSTAKRRASIAEKNQKALYLEKGITKKS